MKKCTGVVKKVGGGFLGEERQHHGVRMWVSLSEDMSKNKNCTVK